MIITIYFTSVPNLYILAYKMRITGPNVVHADIIYYYISTAHSTLRLPYMAFPTIRPKNQGA